MKNDLITEFIAYTRQPRKSFLNLNKKQLQIKLLDLQTHVNLMCLIPP